MDRELEVYVENVMQGQEYRSGIFVSWLEQILQSIADFRWAVNERGSYSMRRSE